MAECGELKEIDLQVLLDLRAAVDNFESLGLSGFVRPMDCGGTNSSPHSRALSKLARRGLAESKVRGGITRGSKLYRITSAGRSLLSGETSPEQFVQRMGNAPATNTYVIVEEFVYVDVSTKQLPNEKTIIDPTDLLRMMDGRGRWRAERGRSGGIYVKRNGKYLHRHILGLPGGHDPIVDHKNRNGLDNRRENFRLTDHANNRANGRRNALDKPYRGVYLIKKSGRYRAMIQTDGKLRSLGCFGTAEEAARRWDEAALERYGEFALLNLSRET